MSRPDERKGPHAYKVQRWRIATNDEPQQTRATSPLVTKRPHGLIVSGVKREQPEQNLLETLRRIQSALDSIISPTASGLSHAIPSLPADSLLHLIHYNTFRGLYNNKIILGTATFSWEPPGTRHSIRTIRQCIP